MINYTSIRNGAGTIATGLLLTGCAEANANMNQGPMPPARPPVVKPVATSQKAPAGPVTTRATTAPALERRVKGCLHGSWGAWVHLQEKRFELLAQGQPEGTIYRPFGRIGDATYKRMLKLAGQLTESQIKGTDHALPVTSYKGNSGMVVDKDGKPIFQLVTDKIGLVALVIPTEYKGKFGSEEIEITESRVLSEARRDRVTGPAVNLDYRAFVISLGVEGLETPGDIEDVNLLMVDWDGDGDYSLTGLAVNADSQPGKETFARNPRLVIDPETGDFGVTGDVVLNSGKRPVIPKKQPAPKEEPVIKTTTVTP